MKSNALLILAAATLMNVAAPLLAQAPYCTTGVPPVGLRTGETQKATAPTTAPSATEADQLRAMLPFLAVGIAILGAAVLLALARPKLFSLAKAPGRPNQLQVMHFLALFLLQVLPVSVVVLLYQHLAGTDMPSYLLIVTIAANQILVIGASLLVAVHAFPLGLRRGLGLNLRHWLHDLVVAVIGWLGVLPLVIGLSALSACVLQGFGKELHPNLVLTYLQQANWGGKALALASGILLAPLAEELMFRGVLQSMLRGYRVGPWRTVLIASGLFAVMHSSVPQDVLPLLPLAIVLGYVYERWGRLLPCILIHALFNALNMLIFLKA